MRIRRSLALLWAVLALPRALTPGSSAAADEAAELDFDSQIAPLLAEHCLSCHNSTDKEGGLDLSSRADAMAGGDSGVVVAPGRPDESLLWQRVIAEEMPPETVLPESERDLLRRWLTSGAKWGSDPIDPFRFTSARSAGYDWWSLQPIVRPDVPPLPRRVSGLLPRSPIDRFIRARLDDAGLAASPEADRRTLIRRLTFDLHGLPPTPTDVEQFVRDRAPGAYERLVDRLLAAPAYGERWARHWLDIVRFGESQGFERDKLRDHAWRYRDWVIDAFNTDLPYDEFASLQLAGDVFEDQEGEGVIATGFLVAGPWDEVGQKQQSAAMKKVVRQDELEDVISAVGQTFLGLTINCARCHDHKFDPVRQSEYYRLAAALNGVRHGERPIPLPTPNAYALRAALAALEERIDSLERPVRRRLSASRRQRDTPTDPPEPIARWSFDKTTDDELGSLDGQTAGTARVASGNLRVDGKTGYVSTAVLDRDLTEKTLEAWVKLDTLVQRGGGIVSVQTLGGEVFDAIVFGERQPLQWMAGSDGFRRTQSFAGPEEREADRRFVHVAIAWHADGTIAGYRGGLPYGTPYQSKGPVTFKKGQAQLLFGLRHSPPGGNRFVSAQFDRVALYDRALTADEVAASAGVASDFISEEQIVEALSPQQHAQRAEWVFEAEHLRQQIARAQATTVYAAKPEPHPEVMHVMLRGNPATPGEVASPGGVAAVVGEAADFGLPESATDTDRRRALAEWITHPENPLFARVIVNRLWHYHFGAGFVATPSDLGFSGGQPTHPRLLDWLAAELIDSGYSLKHIQRLIVTSAVYRQSSRPREDALAVDAENRWLWRMSPRRLEAESVRDAILAVAGSLNDTLGGPGYFDFTTHIRNTQFYDLLDPIGPSFDRRSLYRCWIRSGRNPFLDVFDCPDPSTKTPRRAVTTTPLQALALLNNSFVLRMADRLAERLRDEHPGDAAAQVDRAYRLAYGRPIDDQQQAAVIEFVDEYGLSPFCRVLLNTNEFLYVQ